MHYYCLPYKFLLLINYYAVIYIYYQLFINFSSDFD